MKLKHISGDEEIEKNISYTPSFILTNKKGGYYMGSTSDPFSKFNGLFFPYEKNKHSGEWNLHKTIESIGVKSDVTKIRNKLSEIELEKGKAEETFYFNHSNTLIYELKKSEIPVELFCDCKKIYDDSTEGRIYKITKSKGCVIISYTKYKDNSLKEKDYTLYTAIKTNMNPKYIKKWIKREYNFDKKRGEPSEKWVFKALEMIPLKGKKNISVISYSTKKAEAVDMANKVFLNYSYIKRMKRKYSLSISSTQLKLNKKEKIAYSCAISKFDDLCMDIKGKKGIYAGLPWFFHYWARDEAISSIALIKEENYQFTKNILLKWIENKNQGRVPNRFPFADLGSADATGWIFFRLSQLIEKLDNEKTLKEYFKKEEIEEIFQKSVKRLIDIENKYMHEGLIYNAPLETWMDTGKNVGDLREGYRIEIQTLHIAIYNFIIKVSIILGKNNSIFKERKKKILKSVRDVFLENGILKDGSDDPTIRPNIFIAAYVAPEILNDNEWKSIIKNSLERIYFEKDGEASIRTIAKDSFLYRKNYSGIDNKSYHRGDAWYWLDALVSIILKKYGFEKEANTLKNKLINSILWRGSVGSLAEVSSAEKITSEGCLSQAWSYSLFIEMLNES
ncbi:MAG: amylo-alpha-1,6-glucosidase [Nanobdellota archaeon]